ncbi:MAG: hypothetical protein ACOY4U_09190 [Pseudomonadota bacterium]
MKTFYFGILVILLLTGCAAHVHQMVREGEAPFVGGELVHDRGKDNRLVLEAPNRRYEAHGFTVERQKNLAELRKRYYGVNPKHWKRIFSGLDTEHIVNSFETTAKSADGQEVSCRFAWKSGTNPEGVCTDQAGTAFPVRFE